MVFVNSLRTGGHHLVGVIAGEYSSSWEGWCQLLMVDYSHLWFILAKAWLIIVIWWWFCHHLVLDLNHQSYLEILYLINDGWSAIIILIISIHIILTLIIPGACNILNDVKRVMFSRDMNRVLCDSGLVNTECRGPGGSQLQSHFTSTVGKMVPPFDSSVGEHNSNKYGFCWWYIELVNGIINQLITWGAPPWENVLEIFIRALMNPELTN